MRSRLFTKIKLKLFKYIERELDELKIKRSLDLVTIGVNSRFYKESTVGNLSKDISRIVIGNNTHIRGSLHNFWSNGKIEIGDFCFVGEGTKIWAAKSIKIGDRVMIAHNVNIHDSTSHPTNSSLRHLDYKRIFGLAQFDYNIDLINAKSIVIEDDVWIGFNAIIMKGVKIGKGAIIGAGAVITHDIPSYAVVVGNPSRIIRFEE